jgi:hypothetical protein
MQLFTPRPEENEEDFKKNVRTFLDSDEIERSPVSFANIDHKNRFVLLFLGGLANILRPAGKLFSVIAWLLQCKIFGLIPLELADHSESFTEIPELLAELPNNFSSSLQTLSGVLTGFSDDKKKEQEELDPAALQEKRVAAMIQSDRIAKGFNWLGVLCILVVLCLPITSTVCGFVATLLFLANDLFRVNYCCQHIYFLKEDKFNHELNFSVHLWSRNQVLMATAGSLLGIAASILFFSCPPIGAFFASTIFLGVTVKAFFGGMISLAALACCIKSSVDKEKLVALRKKERTDGIELTLFGVNQCEFDEKTQQQQHGHFFGK